ncbi:HpcH/HpaI aldolase/citrate lyase family protein [Paenibacillus sp. 481]|uniref:HpcH/HpaI aldolase/citrate lyase family protein n=1 Tax=Paenibacillus sp. 481 TaxID=2835869 RepID=UPI001E296E84|nr:HpcH/HpaI aldolase/citrate lyase family protein [Paenibacillus sp. 481]UHA74800.1 HpcH/HpaI aldolase/citrate lyase family protein [Paenibacillus sp. 481]
MRYFSFLTREEESAIFFSAPTSFNSSSNKQLLAHAVGAALYMPATRPTIAQELLQRKHEGLVTIVIDLEDAVGDNQIEQAEQILVQQFAQLRTFLQEGRMHADDLPLIFIRIRTPEQLSRLVSRLEHHITLVAGFVFPKFSVEEGQPYFELLSNYNTHKQDDAPILYGMPILETAQVIYKETRYQDLLSIKQLLDHYKAYVLNVRIGATDFSSLFGLRRSPDMTIYDIGVIRDCMTDIVNVFGRVEDSYVISGAVWEYFKSERVLKPQLRQTPFEESMGRNGRLLRKQFINRYVDGLIREVVMDKENGIIGKTIIHPSHIKPVQSLYAVTHEEFMDASSIIAHNDGSLGVMKSEYSNKMNEIKPHLSWAHRIMIRSKIYGVLHEHQNFTSLLATHDHDHALV